VFHVHNCALSNESFVNCTTTESRIPLWSKQDELSARFPERLDINTTLNGALKENCLHRPVQYLNNVLKQDHRAIKRPVRASSYGKG